MSEQPRVCLVGPSTRFLSGISYYTFAFANALASRSDLSVLFLRRLLPRRLYPGAERVGSPLTDLSVPDEVARYDGLDWYWGMSALRTARFLWRREVDVLVLQWWTGAVLHSYLLLAWLARRRGALVVMTYHEVQDPGESERGWVARYVRSVAPRLLRRATLHVAHSDHDLEHLTDQFGIDPRRVVVVPHAVSEHFRGRGAVFRPAPEGVCNLLFFGLIRPVKGLEDLVRAFDRLEPEEAHRYWLTIVGETWEGHDEPLELVRRSRYRDRITVVNRYVADDEVDAVFSGADVVVLPYRRAAQSGVLHVAMGYGLPVVVTPVGGLVETADSYPGAVLVDPDRSDGLEHAIAQAAALSGTRFSYPNDWDMVARAYRGIFDRILGTNAGDEVVLPDDSVGAVEPTPVEEGSRSSWSTPRSA